MPRALVFVPWASTPACPRGVGGLNLAHTALWPEARDLARWALGDPRLVFVASRRMGVFGEEPSCAPCVCIHGCSCATCVPGRPGTPGTSRVPVAPVRLQGRHAGLPPSPGPSSSAAAPGPFPRGRPCCDQGAQSPLPAPSSGIGAGTGSGLCIWVTSVSPAVCV